MDVTKPYEFIGFAAMDVTKPYEFIGFGAILGVVVRCGPLEGTPGSRRLPGGPGSPPKEGAPQSNSRCRNSMA